jgi:hypothetical protein
MTLPSSTSRAAVGEVYAFLDGYYLARKRFGNLDVPDWHDPGRTPGN